MDPKLSAVERDDLEWTEGLVTHNEKANNAMVTVSTRRLRSILNLLRRLLAAEEPR
jgi:hypothetical protein